MALSERTTPINARQARSLLGRASPGLLDERKPLAIERMFHSDNDRLVLPVADLSEVNSFRASNLHQIACLQTCFSRDRREIYSKELTVQAGQQSGMSGTIGQ